jgi:uncharacterized membrane protein YeaQ/YmgE (transglycosylase-associated protein family)
MYPHEIKDGNGNHRVHHLGLLAGLIAKAIMPGKDPGGYIVTTVIGVVGALIGGFLAAALFGARSVDSYMALLQNRLVG